MVVQLDSAHAVSRFGHFASIFERMRSASAIASVIAHSTEGDGLPSQVASLRAGIAAAINRTRLRPSSTSASVALSLSIRYRAGFARLGHYSGGCKIGRTDASKKEACGTTREEGGEREIAVAAEVEQDGGRLDLAYASRLST